MYREAAEAGERSLELIDSIKNPAERAPANVDGLLAEAYLRAHDVPKSESHFRALDNNVRPYSRFLLISTADKLSAIYQERGDYPAAASKLEVSIAAMEAANPSNPQLPQKEVRLAQLYQRMGRAADAESCFERSLEILEKAAGPDHPDVAAILLDYADLLRRMKRKSEARRLEGRAKAILARRQPPQSNVPLPVNSVR